MRVARSRPLCTRTALIAATLAALWVGGAHGAVNNRLDREVVPTFESVRLKLDPASPDYSGSVHIDLKVATPSASFRLYALAMDVIRVTLTGAGGPLEATFEGAEAGQLIVHPQAPLAPGDYGLDIDFRNDFDGRANALYRLKTGEDWYCFTQFEPLAAREAFPCWDEPAFKIPFQITVTVPAKLAAVSNTPIEKESTIGGQKTVVFKRTPPLPSYLVALAAGPFDFVPIRGLSVPGRVVTVRGSGRLAAEAARITPSILAALEKYFCRPYPYEKLDLLALPEFSAGAMENAGAVTFREEILLIDPASSSASQRYRLASTTAHELAHMWFGDLVTMDWWNDLWLNESFASWMGDKITAQVFPQYNVPVRELRGTQVAMVTDARLSTRAIRQSVDAFANIDRLFDELAYQKGQAVLAMLEQWLGPAAFQRGITAYLKEHEWKNATADDLWHALSAAAGRDIEPTTESFLNQAGVPLVSLEMESGGVLRLRQQRFLNYGVQAPESTTWQIPVTLKYSDGRQVHTQSVLLGEVEKTVRLERTSTPAWVHPNADQLGYYRWSVPQELLQGLAGSGAAALNARERVGLINNLSALLDAGLLTGGDYLRTLGRYSDDPDPDVISALVAGLDKVNRVFVTPGLRGSFAITVRQVMRPALRRFGLTRKNGEPEAVTLMRPSMLAALGVYGYEPEVLEWARPAARRYLIHPESLDASLAGTALDLAAREGDLQLFEDYRTHFESAKVPSDRARFLTALGHFRTTELIEKALGYALIGPLRPQEILTIPRNVADTDELRDRTWRWFKRNYSTISGRIPPSYLPDLAYLADCCSAPRIEDARAFFARPEVDIPGAPQELEKVKDAIRDCAGLREREGLDVTKVLQQFVQGTAAPVGGPGP